MGVYNTYAHTYVYTCMHYVPGSNEKGPAPWKQLGIKIPITPKIDEKENFHNLQDTSKWFPNAYKAPQEQVFSFFF
jgi:hypothetical protein